MAQKTIYILGLLSILIVIQRGNAYDFKVGGPMGNWGVPSDPNATMYNKWAESCRFQIGDTLLFVYDSNKDSVLQVTQDDYTNCNIATPLQKFTDGHTVFKFKQSGPHFFISGVSNNCRKNEKLHLIVMADRSKKYNNGHVPAASPAPSPSSTNVPSPATSPSSVNAPSGEMSPSPPPPDSAPSEESSPPKNGGNSLIVTSGVGIIGAFFCSWIVSDI